MRKILLFLLIPFFANAQIGYTPYPNKSWFKDTLQFSKAMRLNFGGFGTGKVLTSDAEGRVHWDSANTTIDTSILPFYHHITQIDSTTLSWDKLTGVKDTVEFIVSGISDNGFWKTTGNSGTNPAVNYMGTSDAQPFVIMNQTSGALIAVGNLAAFGKDNKYIGFDSPHSVVFDAVDTIFLGAQKVTQIVGLKTIIGTFATEIYGNLKIVDATQGLGKVLTSDANGVASWGLVLDADTFTPVLTGVTNIDSLTTYPFQYMRVGNTVTVSGQIKMKITGVGVYEVGIELPIASDFTQVYQCAGSGTGTTTTPAASDNGYIKADATNNRASFNGDDNDTGYHMHYLTFTYTIQ